MSRNASRDVQSSMSSRFLLTYVRGHLFLNQLARMAGRFIAMGVEDVGDPFRKLPPDVLHAGNGIIEGPGG